MYVESCTTNFLVLSFFCSVLCLWNLSMLLHVAMVHSFSLLCNLPLYKYAVIYTLMGIWIDNSFTVINCVNMTCYGMSFDECAHIFVEVFYSRSGIAESGE